MEAMFPMAKNKRKLITPLYYASEVEGVKLRECPFCGMTRITIEGIKYIWFRCCGYDEFRQPCPAKIAISNWAIESHKETVMRGVAIWNHRSNTITT
jgi:hypothetical protein